MLGQHLFKTIYRRGTFNILGKELKYIAPAYLKVLLPMLRLGVGGCRLLLLLVAWLCKSAFPVWVVTAKRADIAFVQCRLIYEFLRFVLEVIMFQSFYEIILLNFFFFFLREKLSYISLVLHYSPDLSCIAIFGIKNELSANTWAFIQTCLPVTMNNYM